MSNKTQLVIFNLGLTAIIFGALYWCSGKSEKEIKERIDTVNRNYENSKGIITDLQAYKGRTVQIKYNIRNTIYEVTIGWDRNPKSLKEGDSIRLRYSVERPEFVINELENEY